MPATPIESGLFEIDDEVLHLLYAGTGDRAVVFLHGVGARADRWRSTMARCAGAGYRTLAVDFPGHGSSSKGPAQPYGAPAFAHVVGQLLEELGLERPVLVGTSLGAHVAALLAVERPRRVAGLALVGPLGIVPVGAAGREAMATAVVDTSRTGVEAKLRRLVHDDATLVTEEWIDEERSVNSSPGAAAALAAMALYFRTRLDEDVIDDALRLRCADLPSLLVWGARDDLVPASLAPSVLRRLPPGAEFVKIVDSAHAPYLEQPAVFFEALRAWLDRRVWPEHGS